MFSGEMTYATSAFIGTIVVAFGCFLYAWGGRDDKWKRRFVGSLVCSTAIWVSCLISGVFSLLHLLSYPLLITTFVLGYGSDIPLHKVIKRSIVVAMSMSVGVLMCITIGGAAWLVLPLQLMIASGSIWLGVKNPLQASGEEFFVCLLLTECNLMYSCVAKL